MCSTHCQGAPGQHAGEAERDAGRDATDLVFAVRPLSRARAPAERILGVFFSQNSEGKISVVVCAMSLHGDIASVVSSMVIPKEVWVGICHACGLTLGATLQLWPRCRRHGCGQVVPFALIAIL